MISPYVIAYFAIVLVTGIIAMVRMDHITEAESIDFYGQLLAATLMGMVWPLFWLLYIYIKIKEIVT